MTVLVCQEQRIKARAFECGNERCGIVELGVSLREINRLMITRNAMQRTPERCAVSMSYTPREGRAR